MSDNLYQSPRAVERGNVQAPKLGRLVWTVLILDSLPCLFRVFIGIGDVLNGNARNLLLNYPVSFLDLYGFMAGIAVFGLIGNILILLKKRAGIPFAFASILIVLASDGTALWQHRHQSRDGMFWFMVVGILIRVGWLVFYGIVVWIAARRLARPGGTGPAGATAGLPSSAD